ncbi:MAG: hypothetical protein KGM16_04770 [Bacteroidota bacterium]|nr:hypothetical protein [Bacteroidota bacterium]
MQTLILKSDNTKALEAIKTLAKVLDIESSLERTDDDKGFKIKKDVTIIKAKRKFDPKKLAGTLTDLHLEDASVIRKKAWTRKKATY